MHWVIKWKVQQFTGLWFSAGNFVQELESLSIARSASYSAGIVADSAGHLHTHLFLGFSAHWFAAVPFLHLSFSTFSVSSPVDFISLASLLSSWNLYRIMYLKDTAWTNWPSLQSSLQHKIHSFSDNIQNKVCIFLKSPLSPLCPWLVRTFPSAVLVSVYNRKSWGGSLLFSYSQRKKITFQKKKILLFLHIHFSTLINFLSWLEWNTRL